MGISRKALAGAGTALALLAIVLAWGCAGGCAGRGSPARPPISPPQAPSEQEPEEGPGIGADLDPDGLVSLFGAGGSEAGEGEGEMAEGGPSPSPSPPLADPLSPGEGEVRAAGASAGGTPEGASAPPGPGAPEAGQAAGGGPSGAQGAGAGLSGWAAQAASLLRQSGGTILEGGDVPVADGELGAKASGELCAAVDELAALPLYTQATPEVQLVVNRLFYASSAAYSLYDLSCAGRARLEEGSLLLLEPARAGQEGMYKVAFAIADRATGERLAVFDGWYDAQTGLFKVSNAKAVVPRL